MHADYSAMTTVIAISNQKGGVAKTTTSISLGAALVERGHTVLLVDLDPQANLTLALGAEPAEMGRTIADVLMGNYSLLKVCQPTPVPGLDMVPANHYMRLVEKFLHTQPDYERALRRATEAAAGYDFVLCDCPPALSAITLNAMTAADLMLIPTQCEYFSAYGLSEVLGLVNDISGRTNPGLRYRIVVTLFDRRNRIHATILGQIQEAFGETLLETRVEVDTKLRECPVFALPITEYAPHSRGAEQYRALAEELRTRFPELAIRAAEDLPEGLI